MILSLFFAAITLADSSLPVDSLVAKVGREPILLSDVQRFRDVYQVLNCTKFVSREMGSAENTKALLEAFIEDELMYQEARARKVNTAGLIPQVIQMIHKSDTCKTMWQKLGTSYSKFYRTENRQREGESLLVRELEKRVLVDKFRKTEVIADGELWKREAKSRYPVKVYLE